MPRGRFLPIASYFVDVLTSQHFTWRVHPDKGIEGRGARTDGAEKQHDEEPDHSHSHHAGGGDPDDGDDDDSEDGGRMRNATARSRPTGGASRTTTGFGNTGFGGCGLMTLQKLMVGRPKFKGSLTRT
jgi:hypothetical protein